MENQNTKACVGSVNEKALLVEGLNNYALLVKTSHTSFTGNTPETKMSNDKNWLQSNWLTQINSVTIDDININQIIII